MKRTFGAGYTASVPPVVVDIEAQEPPPCEVTIRMSGATAVALTKFIQTGGVWSNGLELNSILHNLRPALQSVGINI